MEQETRSSREAWAEQADQALGAAIRLEIDLPHVFARLELKK